MAFQAAFAPCALPGKPAVLNAAINCTRLRTTCPTNSPVRQSARGRPVVQPRGDANTRTPDDFAKDEQTKAVEEMRLRLEGLFGADDRDVNPTLTDDFDGAALRNAVRERWGVQYDVQPQKRHGRVYVQIMWRYFEQQSFYMQEDEFASHCEAVAQLLQKWNAVDYFCDYIASIKKRPVVGVTINIPIPGVTTDSVSLD